MYDNSLTLKRLVSRAFQLMRLHGHGVKYVGMGMWSYGSFCNERLVVAHNVDGFGIKFDDELIYYLDSTTNPRQEEIEEDLTKLDRCAAYIGSLLVLDDLADV